MDPFSERLELLSENFELSLGPAFWRRPPSIHNTQKDSIETGATSEHEALQPGNKVTPVEYPAPLPLTLIVVALLLTVFISALDITIVSTAIPKITDDFHSIEQVGWYGSGFFLTFSSFQSPWGKAYKYFPLKTVFLLSIIVFEVGSLICAVAQDSTTLIVGRAIAGVGAAGQASGTYIIIAFSVPPQKRPGFTGIIGAMFGVASILGPILGGVFTTHLTWRWCFWINLPIGGAAAAVTVAFFRTPAAAKPQFATWKEKLLNMDIPGTFLILCAIICYLLAMQWGGITKKWGSSDVVGCLFGFVALTILFVVVEYLSGEYALFQGRLLKDRTTAAMLAYVFFIAGPFFIVLYYLPIYFQATRGVSASKSGVDVVPFVLCASLSTIVSGATISATGHYIPLMVLGSILAAIGTGLLYTLQINTGTGNWVGYQIVAGVGCGLGIQISLIVVQGSASDADMSSTTAMVLFFQMMGGTIWLSGGQAGFANKLIKQVRKDIPGINPARVVTTGATELRSTFSTKEVAGILDAYMAGLRVPFAIAIACACVTVVFALSPRWEKMKANTQVSATNGKR